MPIIAVSLILLLLTVLLQRRSSKDDLRRPLPQEEELARRDGPRGIRQHPAQAPPSSPRIPRSPAVRPEGDSPPPEAASDEQPPEPETSPYPYLSEDMLTLDDSYEPEVVFNEAAMEFDVPADLLKAIAYVESNGNHSHGRQSEEGGFGVMRLRERPGMNTLEEAARLLDTEKTTLVRDPAQNIRGATAILRSYYVDAQRTGSGPAPWMVAATLYSGRSPEEAVRYGRELENILREGLSHTTEGGQLLFINPKQDYLLSGLPPAATPQPQ